MAFQANRFYNPKDGTYANVPIIPIHTEKFRGKRQFGTDVLIGNWYEDRSKVSLAIIRTNEKYEFRQHTLIFVWFDLSICLLDIYKKKYLKVEDFSFILLVPKRSH